jgi:hypothetical protein
VDNFRQRTFPLANRSGDRKCNATVQNVEQNLRAIRRLDPVGCVMRPDTSSAEREQTRPAARFAAENEARAGAEKI